ncbi:hypothetical protein JI57_03930 [Psychromonas sp. PRT-SC03]|nr:hypothetical protein JI57_03930 [Psychromonas sp. PRT-SC03]
MDASDLIIDYTVNDFANATRQLLPRGAYWDEAENQALTNLILGMAIDFKTTSDEIQLALLSDFNDKLFGWKLSDYQSLLESLGTAGLVFDDKGTPNLIFVSLKADKRCEKAWFEFEDKRLPHTQIQWIYNSDINVQTQVDSARHIRNLTKSEVTS